MGPRFIYLAAGAGGGGASAHDTGSVEVPGSKTAPYLSPLSPPIEFAGNAAERRDRAGETLVG